MEYFLLYLFVRLNELSVATSSAGSFLFWLSFWIVIVALISVGFSILVNDGWKGAAQGFGNAVVRYLKWPVIVCFTLGCLLLTAGALLPTPKQAAVIIGGGAVYNAVTSDKGKEIAGKIGSKLEAELNKLLEEPVEQAEQLKGAL